MITGFIPLLTLWVITAACWVCWLLTWGTPWRRSPVGQMLFGFIGAHTVWWSLILLGSYAAAYWQWLQIVQGFAFIGVALVLLWMAALMVRARQRSLLPKKEKS